MPGDTGRGFDREDCFRPDGLLIAKAQVDSALRLARDLGETGLRPDRASGLRKRCVYLMLDAHAF